MPRKKAVPEQEDGLGFSPQEQEDGIEAMDAGQPDAVEPAPESAVDAELGQDFTSTEDPHSSDEGDSSVEAGGGELLVGLEESSGWPNGEEQTFCDEASNDSSQEDPPAVLPEADMPQEGGNESAHDSNWPIDEDPLPYPEDLTLPTQEPMESPDEFSQPVEDNADAGASNESVAPESGVEDSAPVESSVEPPKPTRRRRKTAAAEEPAAEAESAPRTRRKSADAAEQTETTGPAQARRRRSAAPAKPQVLSIDEESKVQSAEDKEAYLWMELRGSMRTKRALTGILSGVERTPTGSSLAVVYYKDMRIIIPASEMNINLADHGESREKDLNNRYAQILSWMMGAEIEFTVSGMDKRAGSVVASRCDAMQRKQKHFFLTPGRNGQPLVQEGITAEARVVAVSERVVRVEVFGVETPIFAREVAWEWVDDCNDYFGIGDRVLVKILSIDRDPHNIHLRASIRETAPNPARENIKKCVVQGKYVGKVTDVDRNAIYVRLNVGVNAIALAVHDRRTPCRKDDVSFVVTRVDEDAGIAVGIITRIIKQYL